MANALLVAQRICSFCAHPPNGKYGAFFECVEEGVYVHQYCMFFAAGLPQNGADSEGFDGYLISDIMEELKRTRRLKCSFCKRFGASVGCAVSRCRLQCHFPCGIEFGMLHQYFGNFRSFCSKHKPSQHLSSVVDNEKEILCSICLEKLELKVATNFLKMPCCKDSFIHQSCLQLQALSSGYFFRCPTCNNQDLFVSEMKKFGIYVPERDALWEDGQRYNDLLETYNCCDCRYCQCPKGNRYFRKSGRWEILRCEICGQAGIHKQCASFMSNGIDVIDFHCDICIAAENNSRHPHLILANTKPCIVAIDDILLTLGANININYGYSWKIVAGITNSAFQSKISLHIQGNSQPVRETLNSQEDNANVETNYGNFNSRFSLNSNVVKLETIPPQLPTNISTLSGCAQTCLGTRISIFEQSIQVEGRNFEQPGDISERVSVPRIFDGRSSGNRDLKVEDKFRYGKQISTTHDSLDVRRNCVALQQSPTVVQAENYDKSECFPRVLNLTCDLFKYFERSLLE